MGNAVDDITTDSFRLDHLGLPAQMAEDIDLAGVLDALLGVDPREVATTWSRRTWW